MYDALQGTIESVGAVARCGVTDVSGSADADGSHPVDSVSDDGAASSTEIPAVSDIKNSHVPAHTADFSKGVDGLGRARFICAHAIMLAVEGIPAFYAHSLLGTRNDLHRVEHTGQNRAINRHQWQYEALSNLLAGPDAEHSQVLAELHALIRLRRAQSAFHPNATQYTLQLGTQLFGFWRHGNERRQSVFCVFNISASPQPLRLSDLNLVVTDHWRDLISGADYLEGTEVIELAPYQTVWISNR